MIFEHEERIDCDVDEDDGDDAVAHFELELVIWDKVSENHQMQAREKDADFIEGLHFVLKRICEWFNTYNVYCDK